MCSIQNRTALKLTTGVVGAMFQNGVVGGTMHSSPQIAMGSSIDSHTGNIGLSDAPKRPSMLGVNQAKGYVTKNLRGDVDDDEPEDGSLPSTPEMQLTDSDIDGPGCTAGDEALESDTRQTISRVMSDLAGLTKAHWNESRLHSTMKRVSEDLLEKHRYAYNGRSRRLGVGREANVANVSWKIECFKSLKLI